MLGRDKLFTAAPPDRFSEAVCYGPLHPDGKRLPANLFSRDESRINKLSAECIKCQQKQAGQPARIEGAKAMKICTKCGKPGLHPDDDFKKPFPNYCGPCRRQYYADRKKGIPSKAPASTKPAKAVRNRKRVFPSKAKDKVQSDKRLSSPMPADNWFSTSFENWKKTPEGQTCLNLSTLTPGPYLENRLLAAFTAAWRARLG